MPAHDGSTCIQYSSLHLGSGSDWLIERQQHLYDAIEQLASQRDFGKVDSILSLKDSFGNHDSLSYKASLSNPGQQLAAKECREFPLIMAGSVSQHRLATKKQS